MSKVGGMIDKWLPEKLAPEDMKAPGTSNTEVLNRASAAKQAADAAAFEASETERLKTTQFATRDALMQRQATAAGATRSENSADLLGYVGPRKRNSSAARKRLLGE